jgi:hypothetical protein
MQGSTMFSSVPMFLVRYPLAGVLNNIGSRKHRIHIEVYVLSL